MYAMQWECFVVLVVFTARQHSLLCRKDASFWAYCTNL